MAQVVDASVAGAWCVLSQSTPTTTASLRKVIDDGGHVPAQFWFEVLHSIARAERRGLVSRSESDDFLSLVTALSLTIDAAYEATGMLRLGELARYFSINVYDAAYLDLALRSGLSLATRDARLARAAEAVGVTLFKP